MFLVFLLLCLPAAGFGQDLTSPKDAYVFLLERYASGDVEGAVRSVLRDDPRQTRDLIGSIVGDLEAQMTNLRRLAAQTSGKAPVESRRNDLRRQRLRILKLSLLLHTEAAVRGRATHSHLQLASGTAAHRLKLLKDDYARYGPTSDGGSAAARAAAADEEWAGVRALVRDWYLAVISHLFKARQPDLLRAFIPAALETFDDDAELLLARGAYWELEAMTALVDRSLAREIYMSRVLTLAQQRAGWAATDYERALRTRADLHEARLRLGHAHALRGRRKDAAGAYAAVLASDALPNLRYMAHVFAGELAEEAGDAASARKEYEAALRLYPAAQRPKLALSHACFTTGDRACAYDWLEQSMAEAAAQRVDPWWTYPDGQGWLAEPRMAALRERGLRQ